MSFRRFHVEPYLQPIRAAQSLRRMPPDLVLTASPPSDYAHRLCKNDFFLSSVFQEGVCRSKNATWLYVFKFILFHLLITYIPFEVVGAGYAAFFLSSATKKRRHAPCPLTMPAPRRTEGNEAAFIECLLSASHCVHATKSWQQLCKMDAFTSIL